MRNDNPAIIGKSIFYSIASIPSFFDYLPEASGRFPIQPLLTVEWMISPTPADALFDGFRQRCNRTAITTQLPIGKNLDLCLAHYGIF
jgi:hypothetical protein